MFYPADAEMLRHTVSYLLRHANQAPMEGVRALIVPHAGIQYSGPVAATAYAAVSVGESSAHHLLLGPSHYVPFAGLAVPEQTSYATPLGRLGLDEALLDAVSLGVHRSDDAHRREHCLEVQWPFLQVIREPEIEVLPLLTGDDDHRHAAVVIESILDRIPDTLVIVSSDLSHYLDQRSAERMDRATARAIEELRVSDLPPHSACGRTAILALLVVAANRGWTCRLLDLRTSGDTAGDRESVVGYGAFAFVD
jgi:AmmeMemoRadiSam system protein B